MSYLGKEKLERDFALDVAARFKLIPEFPHDRAVVEDVADVLQEWCCGAIIGDSIWKPELQARWLQRAARDTMPKWSGVPALRALFDGQFPQPEKKPEECSLCGDRGFFLQEGRYRNCTCGHGRVIARTTLVRELNAELQNPPVLPAPAAQPGPNDEAVQKILAHPITQADIDREIAKRKQLAEAKQKEARQEVKADDPDAA